MSQWEFAKLITKYHRKNLQTHFIMGTEFQSDLNIFLKLIEQIVSLETKTYHIVLDVT